MSVLVDTGLFLAYYNKRDGHHARARELVAEIVAGEHGASLTTDHVFSEAVTTVYALTGDHARACELGRWLLGEGEVPRIASVHHVGPDGFSQAWRLFQRYEDQGLSFVDCSTLATARRLGLDAVISFHAGFDGLIARHH